MTKLTMTFVLEERKKALAKYVEQPGLSGAYADTSPKPVIGTLYVRMNVGGLGVPEKLIVTVEDAQ